MLGTHFRELKVQYLTKMENVLHVCIRRNQCAVQWGVYGKQHWWWSDNDARKATGLANYYGDIKSNTTWKCNLEGWMSMHTQFQIKATTFKIEISYMISIYSDFMETLILFVIKNVFVWRSKHSLLPTRKQDRCVAAIKLLEDNTMLISCISQLIAAAAWKQ